MEPPMPLDRLVQLLAGALPAPVAQRLGGFIDGKHTGNVTFNVKDGVILSAKFEEIVKT